MLFGLSLGCALNTDDWSRTEQRSCGPDSASQLCFDARPDRAVELRTGGLTLLPGECAGAPDDAPARASRGRVRGEIVHGDGERRPLRTRVRAGKRTVLRLDADALDAEVALCEGAVYPDLDDPSALD